MRFAVALLILVLLVPSCRNKNTTPPGILARDKMENVLWDVIQADVYTNTYIKKDSSKDPVAENAKMQQQVFMRHNITREIFYSSFDYYKQHPDQMKILLDSITTKKQREKLTPLPNKKMHLYRKPYEKTL